MRSFECGDCSAEDFAAGIVSDWNLPITPEQFLEGFGNWLGGPLAGSDELVSVVSTKLPVGCLSNTNSLHWERHFSQWPLLHAFDHRFLSFELGVLKPDREVFDRVAELLALPADRILFLDDNELNVDGATAAGFQAHHVRGVAEAERALRDEGLLDG